MPVYEYQCKACQKEFEYQQRMSDPEKTTCEACGAEKLERLISRTAFSLKGGGWYKDLYSSAKPESKSADAGGSSGSTSSGSSDAGSTSPTPAAAAPSAPAASTPSAAPSSSGTSGTSGAGGGGTTSKSAASGAK
jgi:putative FmdB family regulatory protein